MHVAFVNIGNSPSLSARSLAAYARATPAIARKVAFAHLDYDLHEVRSTAALHANFTPVSLLDRMVADVCALGPDVVAMPTYIWNSDLVYGLVERLHAMLPDARFVLGGREVDYTADRILARLPYATVVRGEGEPAFRDLLLAWLGEPAPTRIQSTSYVEHGRVVHNPRTGYLKTLDGIPFPYGDCLEEMATKVGDFSRWPRIQYESMRGCPYHCTFCLYGRASNVCYRSPALVVSEIAELMRRGLTVEIVDPVFGLNKRRTKEILSGLSALPGLVGSMTVETYAELLDAELVDRMAASGVGYVGVGLQSVDPDALQTMERKLDARKYERAIGLLRGAGIEFYVDLIYGLPGSDFDGFLRSIDFVYSMGVSRIQMYRLLVMPGSVVAAQAADHDLRHSREPPYEVLSSRTFPLADLLRAQRLAMTYALLMGRLARTGLMERLGELSRSPARLVDSVAERLSTLGFDFLNPTRSAHIDVHRVFREQAGLGPDRDP